MKTVQKTLFGKLAETDIFKYTFETETGIQLTITTYGATILEYKTPDRNGNLANIVVTPQLFDELIHNTPKWGAAIGPVAGRIAHASFTIQNQHYTLEKNQGNHHLHSGTTGYDSTIFEVIELTDSSIRLFHQRKDGTGGFPGVVDTTITYQLQETGTFSITYTITSDQTTLVNPTNHSYFNLRGNYQQAIDEMHIRLQTTGYVPIDQEALPLGTIETADFVEALKQDVSFSELFKNPHPQIQQCGGLDHPFLLDKEQDEALRLTDKYSGRQLIVQTTAPAVVLYTSNGYDSQTTLNKRIPPLHVGVAIETQIVPNAIHQPQLGNMILEAFETFSSTTSYTPALLET